MSAMAEQNPEFATDGGDVSSAFGVSDDADVVEAAESSTVGDVRQPAAEPTGEDFNGLAVLREDGHSFVPDEEPYIKRRVDAQTTDVEMLCYQMSTGRPTLLTAEKGVGKDTLVEYVCAKTNRPMVRVNFGEGITYTDLVGEFQPVEDADTKKIEKAQRIADELDIDVHEAASLVGAESQFEFSPGWLYLAVSLGWTFVADEIPAAGADATMPLHGVTEDDPFLTVLQTSEMIEPHDEFRFIATRNPPEYAGNKPLNAAFESRFWPFPLDYLEEGGERIMLYKSTSLTKEDDKKVAEGITQLASNLRDSYEQRDINTSVSHRETIKIAELIGDEMMEPKSAARFVLKSMAGREDKEPIDKAISTTNFGP